MVNRQKIMIVDDDKNIAELISLYLTKECFNTRIVHDGESAMREFDTYGPNLILLDLMLPGMDGYQVCRELRQRSSVPIIILSAKGEVFDKVLGLELGADDYMIKPFDSKELVARVKAVLRRTVTTETERAPERLTYQSLVIDITKKKVSIDDEEVPLTKKEFEILLLLVQNKGRVFSREDILTRIWSDEVYVLDRTIDVNITRLRKKIGEYGKCIVTRLGYGYCFEAE